MSREENNAYKVLSQLLEIQRDDETLSQLAELCRRVDRGDTVVLDKMTNQIAKESLSIIFALLNMKEKHGFTKSKKTCSFVQLFGKLLPSHLDSALELDREDWLKQRTANPVKTSETRDMIARAQSEFSSSFKSSGTLGMKQNAPSQSAKPISTTTVLEEDDEEDLFGPSIATPASSDIAPAKRKADDWKRAEERALKKTNDSSSSSIRREDWMVDLPELGLRPSLSTLTDRKFSSRSTPLQDQDRTSWTRKS
jgi:hypothetical protein